MRWFSSSLFRAARITDDLEAVSRQRRLGPRARNEIVGGTPRPVWSQLWGKR
jgi:hypothetical protein